MSSARRRQKSLHRVHSAESGGAVGFGVGAGRGLLFWVVAASAPPWLMGSKGVVITKLSSNATHSVSFRFRNFISLLSSLVVSRPSMRRDFFDG